jgi:hypothetical protein
VKSFCQKGVMMSKSEPLEEWLFLTETTPPAHIIAGRRAEVRAGLERLAQFLDTPSTRRRNMADVQLLCFGAAGLDAADVPRTQELYRRVYATGGKGNQLVQESLLELMALTSEPHSIPFWSETCSLSRPHDTFTPRRRTLALAALALLAIRRNAPEAHAALREAAHHPQADLRAQAVYYMGQAYSCAGRPLPPDVQDKLCAIAAQDVDFKPRFQARAAMRAARLPVPMDNPGGVYALRVQPTWDPRVSRTLELLSEQTLDDLHAAIQSSIHWDSDHLYSFYMNGEESSSQYRFASPSEDDRPPWTDEAILGELGLVLGHKFLYLFDYSDGNKFDIEMMGTYPQPRKGVAYPRVVARQGRAPSQYGG